MSFSVCNFQFCTVPCKEEPCKSGHSWLIIHRSEGQGRAQGTGLYLCCVRVQCSLTISLAFCDHTCKNERSAPCSSGLTSPIPSTSNLLHYLIYFILIYIEITDTMYYKLLWLCWNNITYPLVPVSLTSTKGLFGREFR